MANANIFQCVMCPELVRVERSDSDVWLRMVDGRWQIICDRCAYLLQNAGYPCMKIAFSLLKEEQRNAAN
jgi:hypothetical protein